MKKLLLLLLFLPLIGFGQTPDLDWAFNLDSDGVSKGLEVISDNNGHIYVAGWFESTVDFDPGPGVYNLTSLSSQNGFIAKYTASGDFVWARSFECDDKSQVYSVDIDSNFDLVITGFFEGNVDLDPGAGVQSFAAQNATFVVKLDLSSNYLWSFILSIEPDWGSCWPSEIKVDKSDNILITGVFRGAFDFDPSVNQTTLYAVAGTTFTNPSSQFISKYTSAGDFIWARRIGAYTPMGYNTTWQNYDLDIDSNNNIFSIGTFEYTSSLPSGPNYTAIGPSWVNIQGNNLLVKHDSLGNFLWAQQITEPSGCGLKIDNSDNIITVQVNEYSSNWVDRTATVRKSDNNGNLIWTKTWGNGRFIGINHTQGEFNVNVDQNNNIYCLVGIGASVNAAGSGNLDVDPSSNVYNIPIAIGSANPLIQCLDSSGLFLWAGSTEASAFSGLPKGSAQYVTGASLCINNDGSIYTTGVHNTAADFDLTDSSYLLSTSSIGSAWLLKLEGNVTDFPGCTNSLACNYDSEATNEDGSCTYPECYYDCDGGCISDTDSDGVCDELEAPYNPDSDNNQIITITDLLNLFPLFGNSFSATCPEGLQEAIPVFNPDYDDNTIIGLPDFLMVLPLFGQQYIADLCPLCLSGCTDPTAFNYDPLATYEDGSCSYTP